MRASLSRKWDIQRGLLLVVQKDTAYDALHVMRIFDLDVIYRLATSEGDLKARPGGRNARFEPQLVAAQLQPQHVFHRHAIHPTGSARIPGPSTPPRMWREAIDIGGNDV